VKSADPTPTTENVPEELEKINNENNENVENNNAIENIQQNENQTSNHNGEIQASAAASEDQQQLEPVATTESKENHNKESPANNAEPEKLVEPIQQEEIAPSPESVETVTKNTEEIAEGVTNATSTQENEGDAKRNSEFEELKVKLESEFEVKLAQELAKAQEKYDLELLQRIENERNNATREKKEELDLIEKDLILKNEELSRLKEQLESSNSSGDKNTEGLNTSSEIEELKNQLEQLKTQNEDLQGTIKRKEENEQNQATELDKLKEGLTTLKQKIEEFDEEKKRNEETMYEKEVEFENAISVAKDNANKLTEENKQLKDAFEQEKQKTQQALVRSTKQLFKIALNNAK
jgi:DNA repair exonuclease SbcCD ATPase subunit